MAPLQISLRTHPTPTTPTCLAMGRPKFASRAPEPPANWEKPAGVKFLVQRLVRRAMVER